MAIFRMKKKVLVVFTLAIVFMTMSFLGAQTNNDKINSAYQCLGDKIENQTCDSLSTQEKTFSLLSVGECRSELLEDSNSGENECWPSGSCDLMSTSQAVLALGSSDSDDARDWIISQNKTASEIEWFLQIDSNAETSSCDIAYDSNEYSVEIDSTKKLSSGDLGECLQIDSFGYKLGISDTCQNKAFQVSCDGGENFYTNLLFQKPGDSTLNVYGETHSASSGGKTSEKVNSFCFMNPSQGVCDYEGSLWAVLALDSIGESVNPYLPYLLTYAEDNSELLPEAILYHVTGYADFYSELTSKQNQFTGYWDGFGNKYFDTALALLPFSNVEKDFKDEAESALFEDQEDSGCWNSGNIVDTAFILYSIWPKSAGEITSGEDCSDDSQCANEGYVCSPEGKCVLEEPSELDCVDSGYSCLSTYNCFNTEGDVLESYSCNVGVCCSTSKASETCSDLGGNTCNSGQVCDGIEIPASGINVCCDGTCSDSDASEDLDCGTYGGVCEPSQCGEGYVQSSGYSCTFGDICCFEDKKSKKSGALIIALSILILLAILAIVFKDKLKLLWLKMKSGSRKGSGSRGRPKFGPGSFPHLPPPSSTMRRRPMQRSILPRQNLRKPMRKPKSYNELDEILHKLKKIGK